MSLCTHLAGQGGGHRPNRIPRKTYVCISLSREGLLHLLHEGCCSPVLPSATALHLEEVHVVSHIIVDWHGLSSGLWLFMGCIFSREQGSWPESAGLRSGSRGELRRMLAAVCISCLFFLSVNTARPQCLQVTLVPRGGCHAQLILLGMLHRRRGC